MSTKGVSGMSGDKPTRFWDPATGDTELRDVFSIPQNDRQGPELYPIREHRPGEFTCFKFSERTRQRRLMRYRGDCKRLWWTREEAEGVIEKYGEGGYAYLCESGTPHWHVSTGG
jgi:hypothetical protein